MARRPAIRKTHKAVHRAAKRRPSTLAKVGALLAAPIPDVELLIGAMANPDSGIKFVLGIVKQAGKRVSEVQSVLFDKLKWTADAATRWLNEHGFGGRKEEGATFWRFRQADPKKYREFRTIVPGTRRNPTHGQAKGRDWVPAAMTAQELAENPWLPLTEQEKALLLRRIQAEHPDDPYASDVASWIGRYGGGLDSLAYAYGLRKGAAEQNPSPVVLEIQRQLIAQGLGLHRLAYVALDANTLKVSKGTNGVIIRYDSGRDLYDVTEYHGFDELPTQHGLYVNALYGQVQAALSPREGYGELRENPRTPLLYHQVLNEHIRMPGMPQLIVERGFAHRWWGGGRWAGPNSPSYGLGSLDHAVYAAKAVSDPLTDLDTRNEMLASLGESLAAENPTPGKLSASGGGYPGTWRPEENPDPTGTFATKLGEKGYRAVIVAAPNYLLLGGASHYHSSPFLRREDAESFAETMRDTNEQAGRKVASVEIREITIHPRSKNPVRGFSMYEILFKDANGKNHVWHQYARSLDFVETTTQGILAAQPGGKSQILSIRELSEAQEERVKSGRAVDNPWPSQQNPDLSQAAFDAAKQFRLSGAYSETGVANARVAKYGFSRWYNDHAKQELKGKRKATLLKNWMEGWAASKRMEKAQSNPHFNFCGRENPESTAAELYEEFHGQPPSEIKEVVEEHYEHEWFTQLGVLVELKVATVTQLDASLKFTTDPPDLCSSEDGRQLYIVGGDQELDLGALKMGGDKWRKDSMTLGVLYELSYKTEKGFHQFKLTEYYHKLGEETGVQPFLLYDPNNKTLSISGGQYETKPEGIVN